MRDFEIKGPLPGEVLREARRARGLSLQYIARELRLSVKTIDALENDDYRLLPAIIFVQGYIRNYALVLGIDEEALLIQFSEIMSPNQTEQTLGSTLGGNRRRPGKTTQGTYAVLPAKSLSYVAILGLVSVALIIIYNSDKSDSALIDNETKKIASKLNQINSSSSLHRSDFSGDKIASTNKKLKNGDSPNQVPVVKKLPYDILSLKFKKDSYVKVIDADNRELLSHIGRRGFSDKVHGKAPFRIKIEIPGNVEVRLNGTIFKHIHTKKSSPGINNSQRTFTVSNQVKSRIKQAIKEKRLH